MERGHRIHSESPYCKYKGRFGEYGELDHWYMVVLGKLVPSTPYFTPDASIDNKSYHYACEFRLNIKRAGQPDNYGSSFLYNDRALCDPSVKEERVA